MANKKKDQKIDLLGKVRKPTAPPRQVHKDSEGKKIDRGDYRKVKHKGKLPE